MAAKKRRWIIGFGACATVVLGFVGWGQYRHNSGFSERLFNALQLLFLNYSATPPIPIVLWVATWLSVLVTSSALLTVAAEAAGRQGALIRAIRMSRHVVVIGEGEDGLRLAAALTRRTPPGRVVIVATLPESRLVQFKSSGAVVVPAGSLSTTKYLMKSAEQIVIDGASDSDTARMAQELAPAAVANGRSVWLLFQAREIADQWNWRTGTSQALCTSTQLALGMLERLPPKMTQFVAAAPIVVGEGVLGTEIVRRMVSGWQEPAESMRVHAVGRDLAWARAASESLGSRIDMIEHELCLTAEGVVRLCQQVLDEAPPFPPGKGKRGGPTVVVALDDETRAVPLATLVARSMPEARLGVFIERAELWHDEHLDNLSLIARESLIGDLDALGKTRIDLLAEELTKDALHTSEAFEIYGSDVGSDEMLPIGQVLAKHIERVLRVGDIECESRVPRRDSWIVPNPVEINCMADEVNSILEDAQLGGLARARCQELVARLPVLLSRSGWNPQRKEGANLLDERKIRALAVGLHAFYQEAAKKSHNASHSELSNTNWEKLSEQDQASNRSLVLTIPLKLASEGLDWRDAESPILYEFSSDCVERLAEMEHRRWAFYQQSQGRSGRTHLQPWDSLEEAIKEYDRALIRALPPLLAGIGIEIVDAAQSTGSLIRIHE